MTLQEIENRINQRINGKYTIKSMQGFNGSTHSKIELLCTTCNTVFERKVHGLLYDEIEHLQLCPICKDKEKQLWFVNKLKEVNENIIALEPYKGIHYKTLFKCNICGYEWRAETNSVINSTHSGCPKCTNHTTKTHQEFVDEMKKYHPTIKVVGKYTNTITRVLLKCKICNYEWNALPYNLFGSSQAGCANCCGHAKKTTEEIQKIVKEKRLLFEIIGEYVNSKTYISARCLDCGNEFKVSPQQIINAKEGGNFCKRCSDGISYPNKFGRSFLSQLPINNFECEYSPDWIKPYKYDNYFEYENKKYVVEMDGGIGHGKKTYYGAPDTKGKKHDEYKDRMAKEHNIHVIRINADVSDVDYIKKNILNSELTNIFNLSNIDWLLCEKDALKNIVKDVCQYFMSVDDDTKNIAKYFKIGYSTVQSYLRKGAKFGWSDYPRDKVMRINTYDTNNNLIYQNKTISETFKLLVNNHQWENSLSKIYDVLNNTRNSYKNFIFEKVVN